MSSFAGLVRGGKRRVKEPCRDPLPEVLAGVDFGEDLGWALLRHTGERIDSGVRKIAGELGMLDFACLVAELAGRGAGVVAYELVDRHFDRNGRPLWAAAHMWGAFRGVLQAECARAGIPSRGHMWSRVKATAGLPSSGAKPIPQALARWPELVGRAIASHEADALYIAETERLWRSSSVSTT